MLKFMPPSPNQSLPQPPGPPPQPPGHHALAGAERRLPALNTAAIAIVLVILFMKIS
jgi:hypothetical protein